ncbi:MAG: hypothetical protein H0X27_06065, partial [Caulobacteraceae bacterium]|nr:hypothetical protein [Caulobacteraceae bacterium]
AAPTPARAPGLPSPGAGCASAANRQFDFWIGRWAVRDVINQSDGESVIEGVYGGCGLRESWSEEALVGGSISAFNPADGQWRQLWVDSAGGVREFVGGLDGAGRMVLVARYPSRKQPGRTVLDRMTYSSLAGGKVRQYSDASVDGGATWTPLYDNIYTPQ